MKKILCSLLPVIFLFLPVSNILLAQEDQKPEPPKIVPEPKVEQPAPEVKVPDGWITSLEEAQKLAKEAKKDILVNFTGSDWCGWCIKLKKEVFATPEWLDKGVKKYVQVHLDFPKRTPLAPEQKQYNEKQLERFGVEGFPTIFLLDEDGMAYGRTGYQQGGTDKYLEHLATFSAKKADRDKLTTEFKAAAAENKAATLAKLLTLLEEMEVAAFYNELKEEAVTLDADNKAGLRLKYATQLAEYYHGLNQSDKAGLYMEMIKKLDEPKAKQLQIQFALRTVPAQFFEKNQWKEAQQFLAGLIAMNPTGDVAQEMYYYASVAEYHLQNKEQCLKYLDLALKSAPESRVAAYIQQIMQKLKEE